jgi:quercetin dioxygenase-like cupin family protein
MTEQEFRYNAQQDGYAEPSLVDWEANLINEEHTHDFSARIFVLSGELKVVCADRTSVCHAGDNDALGAGTPHAEYVGPEGVKFLAARKAG